MRKTFYFLGLCLVLILIGSCASAPETKPVPAAEAQVNEEKPQQAQKPAVVEKPVEEAKPQAEAPKSADEEVIAQFEGVSITKKDKEIAKSEIEEVVKKLNEITAKKDYGRWRYWLSKDYIKEFSKPEVLKKTSEGLPSNLKGKQLKSIEDYFYYVFVPSRQNGRVDDIAYLTPTKVQVLMMTSTQKLIFYNLEKIDDRWLLVP
ncbi:cell envelope integrity protein TolA [Treponema denticola]|uniref:cell envelope integrity protein TolA n=1 Tax=Treponema denticola TaxID=158 RepID=UPI0020A44594|nr:cell envelope integrity protein TolA [Treponema denticola]UTC83189.1 cell envelope integrity protein TolA [Treponema denticola]